MTSAVQSLPQIPLSAPFRTTLSGDILGRLLLDDLGFHGANGKHSSHSWHPFAAKFPPQLPHLFIAALTGKSDVVLDPMMGSGTTLVEAARLGRCAVGCDIDPLALLIAKVKLVPPPIAKAFEVGMKIALAAQNEFTSRPGQIRKSLKSRFDDKTREFADYWFLPTTQIELAALIDAINEVKPPQLRNFFKLVFSATIIAKSGGVSLARDLAHTRPHKVDKDPPSAFSEFAKRLGQILSAVESDEKGDSKLFNASAKNTRLPDNSVDLIVTSPPYANNAIDYMRGHKFSLVWLGHKISDLSDLRAKYIGHDSANGHAPDDLPPFCGKTADKLESADSKKAAALRRYFWEMADVIREMHRVLRIGKAAVIVVGNSLLSGVNVETQNCLAELGKEAGFELAGIGKRQIDRDRRMMPARWNKSRDSQIEARMHDEFVIGLVKPEAV